MFSSFVNTLKFFKRFCCFLIIFSIFSQANPSYAKDIRVGFIDIQSAVTNTKEWKKEFAAFKLDFKKKKKKLLKKKII